MRHLRMDLDFTVIVAELELLLRTQILVTEKHYAALCDEKSKLISLLVGQILELQSNDLGADVCGEVLDFLRSREECCLGLVCAGAGVGVFSVFIPEGVDILQEQRASWAVLWSWSVMLRLRDEINILTG
jgi:hypothetical protein